MTSDWVLIDLEVKEPDTCESRQTWTLHSDKKKTVSVGFAACRVRSVRVTYTRYNFRLTVISATILIPSLLSIKLK